MKTKSFKTIRRSISEAKVDTNSPQFNLKNIKSHAKYMDELLDMLIDSERIYMERKEKQIDKVKGSYQWMHAVFKNHKSKFDPTQMKQAVKIIKGVNKKLAAAKIEF